MPAAVHTAELDLDCGDETAARIVAAAVQSEAEEGPEGTRAELRQDGARLRVRIESDDLSRLRAALQSLVRLADAAHRVARG